ncbi:KAP family P-loop NTPase fold protein [Pseudomonas juntendi]|uniref:KAP family P-loop NTPase fold protein n=1 Tax=Pseudomonas juntendi TaxID=2666183 RepID=UPI001F1C50D7|nr:P-loop NTPase fold protein [Pseudomonas juntendi]MCO7055334.1 KAP family NTPase [Pseudomonas juntendi]UJM13198.1 KAP family NTPase [Pseudomonas juntendi]UXA39509.1 KAP family NTPase [Pseudomonas juntendi]
MENASSDAKRKFSARCKEIPIEGNQWPCSEDKLSRRTEIENLTPLLIDAQAPLVICLDAPWGAGKTTFLKLWSQYLRTLEMKSLYLNAWENDFADDPLLPLISTFDKWIAAENEESKAQAAWKKAKKFVPGILKSSAVAAAKAASFGMLDIDKELEKLASDVVGGTVGDIVDSFNVKQKSLEQFKSQLSLALEALPGDQNNLVIFIDELDRCRPTYAIEMLERVKHLFDLDRIIFILAMNRDQLGKSIQGVYGTSFNGTQYLKRFIDIDYLLRTPSIKEYISARLDEPEISDYFKARKEGRYDLEHITELMAYLALRFEYTPRDINQLIGRLKLIFRSIPHNHYLDESIIVPLLVLRQENPQLYTRYSKDALCANDVIEFLSGNRIGEGVLEHRIAVMFGYLIGAARDPYFKNNMEGVLAPWIKWSKMLSETAGASQLRSELQRAVTMVIEFATEDREFRSRRGLNELAFKRIELAGEINFS